MATDNRTDGVISQEQINRLEMIEWARNEYEGYDGDIQVDDNAVISHGEDNGAYVQAWVWVTFDGTRLDKEPPAPNDYARSTVARRT